MIFGTSKIWSTFGPAYLPISTKILQTIQENDGNLLKQYYLFVSGNMEIRFVFEIVVQLGPVPAQEYCLQSKWLPKESQFNPVRPDSKTRTDCKIISDRTVP